MYLLACERAPPAVSAMIQPAIFQLRKNIVGWARDLGRKQLMWQDKENGACTWQVPPFVVRQERYHRVSASCVPCRLHHVVIASSHRNVVVVTPYYARSFRQQTYILLLS